MSAMTTRRSRFIRYDKQRVLEEIVHGKLSAQEIAEKFGITRDMVYTLKFQAKKRNLIKDPIKRLDDLSPVEPREHDMSLPSRIHQLAKRWKVGEIDELDFYQALQRMLV
jgi:transposase-like protein